MKELKLSNIWVLIRLVGTSVFLVQHNRLTGYTEAEKRQPNQGKLLIDSHFFMDWNKYTSQELRQIVNYNL